MRAFIVTTFIGCFGVDEKNKIACFIPFSKDPEKIAEKLKLSEIEIIDEEKQMMNELGKRKFRSFVFSFKKSGVRNSQVDNAAEKYIKQNLRSIAIDKKIVADQAEFNKLLTKVNIELTKVKIKKAITRDSLVIQAHGAIAEIDKAVNIFSERLREWYGLHFPEMNRAVSSHEKFAVIVEKFGDRKNIDDAELSQITAKSMGADLTDEDIKAIREFANKIIYLYRLREDLSKYLEKTLKEIAPNLEEVAGPALAANLIAVAGGLDKLAKMPSSTIQLIGAEKALFRFLHGHGKSPKHGIILMHQLVQNAPGEHRGKIARLVASKISIAARLDYYSKENRGKRMKKELEEKVKQVLR